MGCEMSTECNNCKEVEVKVVNTYRDADLVIDELECPHCGTYSQMVSLDADYDPTPDEQGEPAITWKDNKVKPK